MSEGVDEYLLQHIVEFGFRMGTGGMEVDPGMGPESSGLQTGVVTLLHNVIIAGDEQRRVWFAQYLKCMQQKVHTSINRFVVREIVRELGMINSCLTILVGSRLEDVYTVCVKNATQGLALRPLPCCCCYEKLFQATKTIVQVHTCTHTHTHTHTP